MHMLLFVDRSTQIRMSEELILARCFYFQSLYFHGPFSSAKRLLASFHYKISRQFLDDLQIDFLW